MPHGSISLGEIARERHMLRLRCLRCGRAAQYRIDRLLEQYGPDISLRDFTPRTCAVLPQRCCRVCRLASRPPASGGADAPDERMSAQERDAARMASNIDLKAPKSCAATFGSKCIVEIPVPAVRHVHELDRPGTEARGRRENRRRGRPRALIAPRIGCPRLPPAIR
jgi:hypothetical protein